MTHFQLFVKIFLNYNLNTNPLEKTQNSCPIGLSFLFLVFGVVQRSPYTSGGFYDNITKYLFQTMNRPQGLGRRGGKFLNKIK